MVKKSQGKKETSGIVGIVEESIEQVKKEFQENPLNFFVERDIVFRLYALISEKINCKNSIEILDETKSESNKKKFKKLLEIYKGKKISIVHTEVNIGKYRENKKSKDRFIDIGIFNSEKLLTLKFNNGTKRWMPEDLDVAIEVKYIKNARGFYKDRRKKIKESDIAKLNKCKNARKYLLVFANLDIFNKPEWKSIVRENKENICIKEISAINNKK